MATDTIGTVNYGIVKLDRGAAGASNLFTGTIDAVTNLAGGTVGVLAKGTVSTGTVDVISQLPPNNWGTVVSTTAATLGTIKPAVSGSVIYMTYCVISAGSATTVVVASGGTSTPILGTLFFNSNGGIAGGPFTPPIQTVSGSALVYQQSVGTSPITITAGGWVR